MKLAVVIPCYNEEAVLGVTLLRMSELFERLQKKKLITADSFILFVDDGSRDKTWECITDFHEKYPFVRGLKLSGNVGHQKALFAGLMTAKESADVIVSIDADLQDDPDVIEQMISAYLEGNDVVYGVRSERKTDTLFKRGTAQIFYRLMHWLGAKLVYNHADYRLMSKRAVDALSEYGERNLFLRGMVPLVGFQSTTVLYERGERVAGESKYPLKKMISFAIDGITSFSARPLHLISGLGLSVVLLSIAAAIYSLISYAEGKTVPGWTSIILSVWFLGGVILLSVGIVGQYIGKIYIEVKKRPLYHVERYLE